MNIQSPEFLGLLDKRIAEIAGAVFDETFRKQVPEPRDDASAKLREQLTFIKAKEHITVREAALLMSCSDSHIRKLVMLARKRKTARPIPFVELEGMTVFPLVDLLNWAKPQTRLQIIRNEAA